jgi:hypothetical protein
MQSESTSGILGNKEWDNGINVYSKKNLIACNNLLEAICGQHS